MCGSEQAQARLYDSRSSRLDSKPMAKRTLPMCPPRICATLLGVHCAASCVHLSYVGTHLMMSSCSSVPHRRAFFLGTIMSAIYYWLPPLLAQLQPSSPPAPGSGITPSALTRGFCPAEGSEGYRTNSCSPLCCIDAWRVMYSTACRSHLECRPRLEPSAVIGINQNSAQTARTMWGRFHRSCVNNQNPPSNYSS